MVISSLSLLVSASRAMLLLVRIVTLSPVVVISEDSRDVVIPSYLSHMAQAAAFFLTFFEGVFVRTAKAISPAKVITFIFAETSNFVTRFAAKVTTAMSSQLNSNETLIPSFSWQERELGEMLGVFLVGKSDKRSALLPSMQFLAPLVRTTPTGGFYSTRPGVSEDETVEEHRAY